MGRVSWERYYWDICKTRTEKLGVTRISQNKRLRRGKQVNRNFGIKSFLSQNLGGMCLHQNLGRRTRGLEAFKIVSIKESIA